MIQVRLQEWKTPINALLILCSGMTYKMAMSFKLNDANFPSLFNSTVSVPVYSVSSFLSCTTTSRSFSNHGCALSFKSLSKPSDKPFFSATKFSPGNFALNIYTVLPKRSYLILLIRLQLNLNISLSVNLPYCFSQSFLI